MKILWLFLCFFLSFAVEVSAADKPFTVGAILPLSGPMADYGTSIQNCIQLAEEDRPELFKSVKFRFDDAQYDVKAAVSHFQRLIREDSVDLLYVWGISFCKALAPLAESTKHPLVAQCIDPVSAKGRRYVVRFMNVVDDYLEATTRYLEAQSYKKLTLLVTENPYLEEMRQALHRTLQPSQTIILEEQIGQNEMDFRALILKLRAMKSDAVGVFLLPGQIAAFYKQVRELQYTTPTFGTNTFQSVSEVRSAGGTMNGAVFATNEISDSFVARYKERFHNVSQLAFGALAYEFAVTVGEQVKAAKARPTGVDFLQSLSLMNDRKGDAAGPYRFIDSPTAGRSISFPVVMKKIVGNEFETVVP